MTLNLLLIVALGLALLVGLRPAYRWLLLRVQLRPLLKAIAKLRAAAALAPRYDPVPPGDPRLVPLAEHFAALTDQLVALGFRSLGDACEVSSNEKQIGVVRWVASGDGTVSGWFGVVQSAKATTPVMVLLSEVKGRGFAITRRGGSDLTLTRAPTIVHHLVNKEAPLAEMVETHAQAKERLPAGSGLSRAGTLEDAAALLGRFRTENLAWRSAQPADQLLKADLCRVLEHAYVILGAEKFGKLFSQAAVYAGFEPMSG
jgi:hypothetical protein